MLDVGEHMATLGFIEYADSSPEVRAVYDDIMRTRNTDWINNFWKALAHDPASLRRTWQSVKEIMAAVGCSDQSHFVKDFERAYGLSPCRYRQEVFRHRRNDASALRLIESRSGQ